MPSMMTLLNLLRILAATFVLAPRASGQISSNTTCVTLLSVSKLHNEMKFHLTRVHLSQLHNTKDQNPCIIAAYVAAPCTDNGGMS